MVSHTGRSADNLVRMCIATQASIVAIGGTVTDGSIRTPSAASVSSKSLARGRPEVGCQDDRCLPRRGRGLGGRGRPEVEAMLCQAEGRQ